MRKIVIIPTYNESENIESIIKAVLKLENTFDILVVDDSSPDGTFKKVKALQIENPNLYLVIRKEKNGLGKAYIEGFKWALQKGYDYIFEMDADFSHNPKDLTRLYETAIKNKKDLVIGSRYSHGVNVVNWPMSRVLLSFFASKYAKFITGLPVNDSTAGFVCYSKKALETIHLNRVQFSGYGFQIEMKFRIWKKKLPLEEIPIIFTDRVKGTSKMDSKIIFEGVFGLIILKLKSIFNQL